MVVGDEMSSVVLVFSVHWVIRRKIDGRRDERKKDVERNLFEGHRFLLVFDEYLRLYWSDGSARFVTSTLCFFEKIVSPKLKQSLDSCKDRQPSLEMNEMRVQNKHSRTKHGDWIGLNWNGRRSQKSSKEIDSNLI